MIIMVVVSYIEIATISTSTTFGLEFTKIPLHFLRSLQMKRSHFPETYYYMQPIESSQD